MVEKPTDVALLFTVVGPKMTWLKLEKRWDFKGNCIVVIKFFSFLVQLHCELCPWKKELKKCPEIDLF